MNKLNYKLIILDVDGTMLDTSRGLLSSVEYTINKLGLEMPEKEVLETFVGPRIQDSLKRVYGLEGEELGYAANIFREYYKKGDVYRAEAYSGIYELLEILKEAGCHIAVATNKRQDFADMLMQKYRFTDYIQVVYGTDIEGKFTKQDLIKKCLDAFPECSYRDAVLIGDSSYDAEAANRVKVAFIGVTYGFGFHTSEDVDQWENVGSAGTVGELLKFLF